MHPDWLRGLRDQCLQARVPFFFKQWGEWIPEECLALPEARAEKEDKLIELFGRVPYAEHIGAHNCGYYRVGKKAAGRTLDCVIYNQMPEVKR